MRKLTGYIGAMIIVFALMGSVLLGFALNINGQSTVINDYEKITDVSGLYTHSEEKTYLEYNPASNYTGYSTMGKYDNSGITGYLTFKNFKGGSHTFIFEKETVTIDGINQDAMIFNPASYHLQFISEKLYIQYSPVADVNRLYVYGENTATHYNKITLTVTGNTISYNAITTANVTVSGSVSVNNDSYLSYYSGADWDYIELRMYSNPNITDAIPAYYSNEYPIFSAGLTYGTDIIAINENAYDLPNNSFSTINLYTDTDEGDGVYHTNDIRYSNAYETAIPRYVYYNGLLGINYTESNRVNNYLVEIENIGGTQTTTNQTLNLYSGMNLTDYATNSTLAGVTAKYWFVASYTYSGTPFYAINYSAPSYTGPDYSNYVNAIHSYKLLDVLNFYNVSTNEIITIRDGGGYQITLDGGNATLVTNNLSGFSITPNSPSLQNISPNAVEAGGWILYNPNSGIVEWYSSGGTKLRSDNINDVYITFSDASARYGLAYKNQIYPSEQTLYFIDYGVRETPHIDISYTTITGGSTIYHYMDITKGAEISPDNIVDTIWNNAYENGKIQLLFRANDLNGTYQNTITVCGNDINIDYTNNRYYITLGADTVDIGTWRNIVLDIDLINGKLSAIPVRTFNSFTNVVLDNSVVYVGDLVGATPTNTITWAPSSNSLMFSVYSTDVFLNTYGVVMVNPSLTIIDYFPDLGQFYRLKIYNFATYGDNITINGVTYPVSNGTITIDNKVVTLKNLYIEYANGNVTVKDDHVEINTGAIVSDTVSMTGTWYFLTDLERGYTTQKMIYDWDWGTFILDNTAFVVIYVGLLGVSLVVARRFCNLSITDYALMIVSVIIALSVQVIA